MSFYYTNNNFRNLYRNSFKLKNNFNTNNSYYYNLDRTALRRILTEPKNALSKQYQKLLQLDGIKLTFEEGVFDYIVEKAEENNVGARGLRGIMEDLMNKAMFNLPSTTETEFEVTLDYAKEILDEITYKED